MCCIACHFTTIGGIVNRKISFLHYAQRVHQSNETHAAVDHAENCQGNGDEPVNLTLFLLVQELADIEQRAAGESQQQRGNAVQQGTGGFLVYRQPQDE